MIKRIQWKTNKRKTLMKNRKVHLSWVQVEIEFRGGRKKKKKYLTKNDEFLYV